MKYAVILIIVSLSMPAAEYSDGIKFAIEQLRLSKTSDGVPVLSGRSSNFGGVHGTFYLLYPYFFARATRDDVALMLKDSNPLIRILGARRVLDPFMRPLPLEAIDVLSKDMAEVRVGPIYEPREQFATMTVAAVIKEMRKDPEFLFKHYYGERVRLDYVMEALPPRTVRAVDLPMPDYPPEMLRARISGEVTLRFVVKVDGSIGEVSIVRSSQREFEPAAKSAVSRWKFSRTAESDGAKAVLECRVTFDFKD